jgi:cation transport ATPase
VTESHLFTTTWNEKQFYQLVASAEMGSEHPLAVAIVAHAKTIEKVVLMTPDKFEV